tara:strand:- start:349 stop:600 length:252 start_codon:yes stop_codon:yes gene_type:complete
VPKVSKAFNLADAKDFDDVWKEQKGNYRANLLSHHLLYNHLFVQQPSAFAGKPDETVRVDPRAHSRKEVFRLQLCVYWILNHW